MVPRELRESRRLTGPNVLWERPGAVIDVALDEAEVAGAVASWSAAARRLLDTLGWTDERLTHRIFPGGVSLALSAPIDALYAATEINEAAWREAERRLDGGDPSAGPPETVVESLRATLAAERNPALLRMAAAARRHGVAFLADDDHASVGLGAGSITWPVAAVPAPETVGWDRVHDIPVALVTGTNGKTTTVRMVAAMIAAAGRTPGVSSTDWLKVGDETLDSGDWSGPGGARAILRQPGVEIAVLETARGGMLRRGLGVAAADVAAILNIAEDHLGEWGIEDIRALVETKFVVARAARHLVLNADDPLIVERAQGLATPITWFALDRTPRNRRLALGGGNSLLAVEGGEVRRLDALGGDRRLATVESIPIALGGVARHNLANALAAAGVALQLGLDEDAVRAGLAAFHSDPHENPGRLNRFDIGGVHVLVDFAHNPHGLEAVLDMAAALPARRRLVLVGQAGDRTDSSIRDLARIVWSARPERVVIKEMTGHLRGREPGEVPRLLTEELIAAGAPAAALGQADSEIAGVRQALAWSRPGDLLLLLSHEAREEVLALCQTLERDRWRPGLPLP
jgi:UDP-N-acetylmuramyl tripeptide synthase